MKKYKFLLPLLLLYVLVGSFFTKNSIGGDDESRYWRYANNITNGFYSSTDNIELTNGPGYPMLLAPFVLLKTPISLPKYLNILFLFFSIIFFYKTLSLYLNKKHSVFFAYILGLYIPMYKYIIRMETEMLTFLLISAFVYYFCLIFYKRDFRISKILLAAFILCYLALTKVFFGYVIAFSILSSILFYIIYKNKVYKIAFYIYSAALLFCLPYLLYTYSLTNKIFYWSTNGGDTLYSSVSPYADEYGDYIIGPDIFDTTTAISKNHFAFVNPIKKLSQFKRDQLYKQEAIKILKAHPLKYVFNWCNNLGRLIFNYPYSHTVQKPGTFFYIIPNSFLFALTIFLLYPFWLNKNRIPKEIKLILLFGAIYFWGSTLIDAEGRHFAVIVPVLLLGIAYMLSKIIRIEINEAAI